MQLTEIHHIKKSNRLYKDIDNNALLSKNLYNATLFAIRQHYFTNGTYLSYATLCNTFTKEKQQDYVALPRKVAQQTMRSVDKSFKSFFNALNVYKSNPSKFKGKPRLPKYLEKDGRYVISYTSQAIRMKGLDKDGILMPSGIDLPISTKLSKKDINGMRIVRCQNGYNVELIYTVQSSEPLTDNGKYASIDLGVNNFATVTSNAKEFNPFIVDGRYAKSVNRYYNKELANFKSILSERKQGKNSHRINTLCFKRQCILNYFLHNASKLIVNQLVSNNINTLIVGKNNGWKQDTKLGRKNNQNFINLPYDTFINMLQYKCGIVGIKVILQEESYTSKCSFLDKEPLCKHDNYVGNRKHRGLFVSADGVSINADVNGSYNILRKCKPNAFADGVEAVVVQPMVIKTIKHIQ